MKRTELDKKWEALSLRVNEMGGDGEDFVAAMKELYTLYDDRQVTWLAGLFEPDIGGFYYSNSARDNEQFLPDIESTIQAIGFLLSSGMISSYDELPVWMKEKIINFTCSLQDPEDGYIYHPQWGKNIPDYRRGRDMTWANALQGYLGFKLPYPTALDRLKEVAKTNESGEKKESNMPEHLRSKEAFIEYLDKLDFVGNAYVAGSYVASQGIQIVAAGLAPTAIEYLNKFQDPKTGIWGKDKGYMAINGALKISDFYTKAGAEIQNADKICEVAMECISSDEDAATVCFQYNVWFTIYNMFENLRKFGGEDGEKKVQAILRRLIKLAPEGIRATRMKVAQFKKADGPFSYLKDRTAHFSQDVPVAIPYTNEGDVNASVICTTGTVSWLHNALDLTKYQVPIFTDEDYELFKSALKAPQK